ncbi:hypothetical protein AB6A40_009351 [Gnathostoma spinigerum]|uniref:Uncharacterized protein n=1 Tax=Gnathostoma spinigerum TaxID=75299 RepID=A0ABD6F0N1_9BILA
MPVYLIAKFSIAVDTTDDISQSPSCSANPYFNGRRRRMSLLQSLRYQNKQLADSGFIYHPSDASARESVPSQGPSRSPISEKDLQNLTRLHEFTLSKVSSTISEEQDTNTSRSSFMKLKAKTRALFARNLRRRSESTNGRRDSGISRTIELDEDRATYASIDRMAKANGQRTSPSTNDSGRGSQGRIAETINNTSGGDSESIRDADVILEEGSPSESRCPPSHSATYYRRSSASFSPYCVEFTLRSGKILRKQCL